MRRVCVGILERFRTVQFEIVERSGTVQFEIVERSGTVQERYPRCSHNPFPVIMVSVCCVVLILLFSNRHPLPQKISVDMTRDGEYDAEGWPLSRSYWDVEGELDYVGGGYISVLKVLGPALVVEDGRLVRKHRFGFGLSLDACDLHAKIVADAREK